MSVPDDPVTEYVEQPRRSPVLPTTLFIVSLIAIVAASIAADWIPVSELLVWCPLIQLVAALVIQRTCGRPTTPGAWVSVLTAHLAMLVLLSLLATGRYDWAKFQILEGLLRLLLSLIWLLPMCGLLLIAETVRRRKLRWRRWVPGGIRLCLGATLVLVGVEGTALLIEHQKQLGPITTSLPQSPGGEIRVAAIGGSTMLGFPYDPEWGIGNVAVCQLRQLFPDQHFVLDNVAITGMNLELAIGQISHLQYRPDILLIYSGHNEYFHDLDELTEARKTAWRVDDLLYYSPAFRLISPLLAQRSANFVGHEGGKKLCGRKLCPDSLERTRLQRYSDQLRALFRWAASGHVTVLYCIPASDEADSSPNRSLCHSSDPAVHAKIKTIRERVLKLQQQERWEESLTICEDVLKQEPEFAEFHYRAGLSCRALGNPEQAHHYFQNARDLDQYPIRARSSYCEAGRAVARASDILTVDCPEILRQHSPDGISDRRFFLDGVHPNLRTTYLLGQAVANVIAAADCLPGNTARLKPAPLSFQDCVKELDVTSETLVRAYLKTALVLEHYSDFPAVSDGTRERAAEDYRRIAEQLSIGAIHPGEGGAEALEN